MRRGGVHATSVRLSVPTPPYRSTSAKSLPEEVVESPRKVVDITRKIVESLVLTAEAAHYRKTHRITLSILFFNPLGRS